MKESTWKRTFYTIWSGQAASLLTSAIVQYALIWSLTAQTKSALVLSMAGLVAFLPTAIFSPFIGSYVDKHNRKKIMMIADFVIALSTLVLVVVSFTQALPIWLVYIALFVRALGSAFHEPCLQAITPLIVPKEQLAKCGGYTSTLQSISLILSPAISAALFAIMPLWFILLLDIIGAVIGISTIAISKIPRLIEEEKKELNVIEDTKEGFKILQKERGLYYFVLIVFLFYITYIPLSTLYPLMSVSYFNKTIGDAGLVETMFSVGMLAGGLILGLWGGTKDKMKTILSGVFLLGIGTMFQGLLPQNAFIMFVVLAVFTGLAVPFISSLFMTIIQEKIAPAYLGRVIGVAQSIMAFAAPIGLMLSGLFAEQLGVHNWFVISGMMAMICMVLCLMVKSVRNLDRT
ncbi:DHA3 family macrolide efflux protein-like MFS transporter [Breznakia sp. PF5-3]|uniref:MFS transporter n=1 Tax=unclassified Breznakia TaxID=2623764 RepID=UPI002404FBB7|nr:MULTISPECIES: MFS transporter [unclassified Breznakia]MDF9825320.1 DHA3 family macrolide efflux protein-like MFS transporter [Breznakia sp. PM6-1]MDF9836175.1 DHA3 family macrolide efflux protein-like MFS transporter [Breznakia sp. PF5-3]MDF9838427.1 DHA3 family macrolide efflux protein-like MFS transporter [Breznakia sp. PFB2-8]MDF9860443.1 DHA3 family macrolide efflux protein-like MFS transporter [Breznakia sp. PH5-24]